MSNHRFILQPYKGVGSRYCCPTCHKKRCFSRYIDTEKQISFPDDVGRCDHEQSCGYHLTPKEYFERNPQAKPLHSDFATRSTWRAKSSEQQKLTSFIAAETVSQTLHGYEKNNLYLFLRSKFGAEDALCLMKDYRVSTSKHWPGSCVFWQTDADGDTRTGKVMLYDAETGKRVKEPYNHVTWVHSLLKLPDFNLRQCFFGEHLLPMNRGKPVALVESEKTALVAAYYLPEYVWLATGGKNGCFLEEVATDDERTAGLDIADYLLQIEPDQAILQSMIRRNPILQKLIDDLQCTLVSVERDSPDTDAILKPSKTDKS